MSRSPSASVATIPDLHAGPQQAGQAGVRLHLDRDAAFIGRQGDGRADVARGDRLARRSAPPPASGRRAGPGRPPRRPAPARRPPGPWSDRPRPASCPRRDRAPRRPVCVAGSPCGQSAATSRTAVISPSATGSPQRFLCMPYLRVRVSASPARFASRKSRVATRTSTMRPPSIVTRKTGRAAPAARSAAAQRVIQAPGPGMRHDAMSPHGW